MSRIASTPGSITDDDINQLTALIEEDAGGTSQQQKSQQREEPSDDDDGLPDKLRGKSATEIAEMYTNLQSAYGRMANELGSNRKLLDEVLALKRQGDLGQNTPQEVNVTQEDLLERPAETIKKVLEAAQTSSNNKLNQRLDGIERTLVERDFKMRHPDAQRIADDPRFLKFVQASPLRMRAAQAGLNGDLDALGDVLDEYKEARKAQQKAADEEQNAQTQQARNVALESGGSVSTQSDGPGGKIYSRAALRALRQRDRAKYYSPEVQAVIRKAYAEGRVR